MKDLASDVAGRARQLVSDELVERQHSGADQLAKVADALRKADLKDTLVEPYREKAANVVERLSDSVRDAELADVTQATERFARRAPLQFVGGALALGFAAGRFLRSSARRRSSRMGVGAGGANDGGH